MKKSLLLLFLISFVFSCGKKGSNIKESRFVKVAILAPIRSLNPRIANEIPCTHVITMLYEGLMRLGPNGEILPGAAESVDVSEDECIYTFHLRDSFWSNGDPVTAYDFEYAWKKSVNPNTAQNGAITFYSIKNVEECLSKKASIDDVGMRALDDRTFQVVLEHPAPYFLSLCARPTFSPIHKKFDQEDPQWANTVNSHFVCNGPFRIKQWKKGNEITLEKNPHFWDAEGVSIPGICIQIVPDDTTQYFLFEKGKLDWVGEPFNPMTRDLFSDGKCHEYANTIDAFGLSWFFLNTSKPPFDNKNLRKAFAYALDRESIAENVFRMGEEPAMGILNQGISLQEKPYFADGNIELAQKHFQMALDEMGLTRETFPIITMSQRSSLFISRITQAVQEQLRVTLGVKIEVDHADWPVHFVRIQKGDYEMGEMSWHSWMRDPIYMLDTFRSRYLGINMSRWEHPHYKELLALSDYELDPIKRKEYLRQAEELLMEEMPVIPVCYTKLFYLKNPELKGVYVSPLKEIEFRYAYFAE